MNREQQMVLDFHKAMGHPWRQKPQDIPREEADLRLGLLKEEMIELTDAMIESDLVGIADALADILYVTYGIGLVYGIDLEGIYAEVHRTNMLKQGGPTIRGGKQGKPPGWQPPRIAECLAMLQQHNLE